MCYNESREGTCILLSREKTISFTSYRGITTMNGYVVCTNQNGTKPFSFMNQHGSTIVNMAANRHAKHHV
jgi:hypothetical protein